MEAQSRSKPAFVLCAVATALFQINAQRANTRQASSAAQAVPCCACASYNTDSHSGSSGSTGSVSNRDAFSNSNKANCPLSIIVRDHSSKLSFFETTAKGTNSAMFITVTCHTLAKHPFFRTSFSTDRAGKAHRIVKTRRSEII